MLKPSFEDCLPIINEEIAKRRGKWMLSSIAWLDYDDVAQIIRFHIYVKWALYDNRLPLRNWLSTVIANQTRNIIRNVYVNNAPVCHRCPANQGNELCAIFGQQGNACFLFRNWKAKKGEAFNVNLPVSLDHHMSEAEKTEDNSIDIDATADKLHKKMQTILGPTEWEIYKLLFIEHLSEEEASKRMGYRTTEKSRIAGYKTIANFRKSIISKVKEIIYGGEIDFIK